MLDSKRIFIANIGYAFRSPGPIGSDKHSLDNAVGISFEHAAVHIGTRVTFIGIAHKELTTAARLFCQQLPFQTCGKAATTPAAQSGTLDLFHYPSAVAFVKYFHQYRISAGFDVIINADGIHLLIPGKKPTNLFIEKRYIILLLQRLAGFRVHEKNICKHFVSCSGLDNTFHLFEADPRVKNPAGFDKHRGLHLAETVASGDTEMDLFGQALRQNLALGYTDKVPCSTGLAACPCGNNYTGNAFISGIKKRLL